MSTISAIVFAIAQAGGKPQATPAATPKADVLRPTDDTMYLETTLGSFKVLNGRGKFSFTFKGTVLVSGLDGNVTVTGNVKKEYDREGRVAYFGAGGMELVGTWRGLQWFGENMKATFTGEGAVRLFGEFDKDLNTGFYWYKSLPAKNIWYTSGIETKLPPADFMKTKPTRGGG
ncbi:MAG: hypothetical protein ABL949_03515 [Fimbriimonadaceae bacterium]